jgi:hypothetical protein
MTIESRLHVQLFFASNPLLLCHPKIPQVSSSHFQTHPWIHSKEMSTGWLPLSPTASTTTYGIASNEKTHQMTRLIN